MTDDPVIVLASASPRRRLLLEDAGWRTRIEPPDLDDGPLVPGSVSPGQWVMALAYLKARCVAERLGAIGDGAIVLGADTVCVHRGRILGQPRDAEDARRMLRAMRGDEHCTMTGVCLLIRDEHGRDSCLAGSNSRRREMFVDGARVRIGPVTDREIDAYIATGDWRGKAGAYNLSERQAAGWPIECEGDPATVMGLPMKRLRARLARCGALQP
jgi:septum formation protein